MLKRADGRGWRGKMCRGREDSVEEALAADGAAEAGYAIGGIEFAFEFVVVGELFVCGIVSKVERGQGLEM